jgi:hypothetical protein
MVMVMVKPGGAMTVAVPRVPGQNPSEVPFAVDQEVVETLPAQRSRISLSAWGDRTGILMTRAVADEHVIEGRRELAVAVADEEPEPGGAFAGVHEKVAALEEHGADVQEIARQDPVCLGGRELPPGP